MSESHEPGPSELTGALEALLLMAEEPMAVTTLAEAVQQPVDRVSAALVELGEFYDRTGRGFELRHIAGGWRYFTRSEHAGLIERWVLEGQQSRLSQAALETLAVIAYLQPVSRSRISAVRGVSVDQVVRTLAARGLVTELGTDEETGAVVFGTTALFCEKMGLASLSELPALAPHLPEASELEAELGSLAGIDAPSLEPTADTVPTEAQQPTAPTEPGTGEPGTGDTGTDETGIGETEDQQSHEQADTHADTDQTDADGPGPDDLDPGHSEQKDADE